MSQNSSRCLFLSPYLNLWLRSCQFSQFTHFPNQFGWFQPSADVSRRRAEGPGSCIQGCRGAERSSARPLGRTRRRRLHTYCWRLRKHRWVRTKWFCCTGLWGFRIFVADSAALKTKFGNVLINELLSEVWLFGATWVCCDLPDPCTNW